MLDAEGRDETSLAVVSSARKGSSRVIKKASYLHDIYIQDFALVEEQYARLHPCFNVITGKSGSGKSVFLDAISQLCGAPAHKDLVRTGADCAICEERSSSRLVMQPSYEIYYDNLACLNLNGRA